jgi:hypothetical protein
MRFVERADAEDETGVKDDDDGGGYAAQTGEFPRERSALMNRRHLHWDFLDANTSAD